MLVAHSAAAFEMGLPLNCKMGEECYIRSYVDHLPNNGFTDYTCGQLSYNGSKGTDFAVGSLARYEEGVEVLAVQDGKVSATRDFMPDTYVQLTHKKLAKGRECGNTVVIEHKGGWKTQYCHLKKESLTVEDGDEVKKGQVIAHVGFSGNADYRHLHFSVRKDNRYYDPFTARDQDMACSVSPQREMLWEQSLQKHLNYKPSGHIASGFNDVEPDASNNMTRADAKTEMTHGADGLYFWSSFYGVKAGDEMQLKLVSPTGVVMARERRLVQENSSHIYDYVGITNEGLLVKGSYKGHYSLVRSGATVVSGIEKVTIK